MLIAEDFKGAATTSGEHEIRVGTYNGKPRTDY
jgi:hypothetical protein